VPVVLSRAEDYGGVLRERGNPHRSLFSSPQRRGVRIHMIVVYLKVLLDVLWNGAANFRWRSGHMTQAGSSSAPRGKSHSRLPDLAFCWEFIMSALDSRMWKFDCSLLAFRLAQLRVRKLRCV
jgi:hypothetical protein